MTQRPGRCKLKSARLPGRTATQPGTKAQHRNTAGQSRGPPTGGLLQHREKTVDRPHLETHLDPVRELLPSGITGAAALLIATSIALLTKATSLLTSATETQRRMSDAVDRFIDTIADFRSEVADLRAEVREIAHTQNDLEQLIDTERPHAVVYANAPAAAT